MVQVDVSSMAASAAGSSLRLVSSVGMADEAPVVAAVGLALVVNAGTGSRPERKVAQEVRARAAAMATVAARVVARKIAMVVSVRCCTACRGAGGRVRSRERPVAEVRLFRLPRLH